MLTIELRAPPAPRNYVSRNLSGAPRADNDDAVCESDYWTDSDYTAETSSSSENEVVLVGTVHVSEVLDDNRDVKLIPVDGEFAASTSAVHMEYWKHFQTQVRCSFFDYLDYDLQQIYELSQIAERQSWRWKMRSGILDVMRWSIARSTHDYPLLDDDQRRCDLDTIWEFWEDDTENEQLRWLWNFLEDHRMPGVSLGHLYTSFRYAVTEDNEYVHRWITELWKDPTRVDWYEMITGVVSDKGSDYWERWYEENATARSNIDSSEGDSLHERGYAVTETTSGSELAMRCVTIGGRKYPGFTETTSVADSGSSVHIEARWRQYLINARRISAQADAAGGSTLTLEWTGDVPFKFVQTDGTYTRGLLKDAKLSRTVDKDLYSLTRAMQIGHALGSDARNNITLTTKNTRVVMDRRIKTPNGWVAGVEIIPDVERFQAMQRKQQLEIACALVESSKKVDVNALHCALTHPSLETTRATAAANGWTLTGEASTCMDCALAKAKQRNVSKTAVVILN